MRNTLEISASRRINGLVDRYLKTNEAAEFLGLSPRTLEGLRLRGGGPVFTTLGGRKAVRYRLSDLESWARAGLRVSTSDPGRGNA